MSKEKQYIIETTYVDIENKDFDFEWIEITGKMNMENCLMYINEKLNFTSDEVEDIYECNVRIEINEKGQFEYFKRKDFKDETWNENGYRMKEV